MPKIVYPPDYDPYLDGSFEDEENACSSGIRFKPPLYIQRYNRVIEILKEHEGKQIHKVVDFGCAECKFVNRARFSLKNIRTLVGVDIDKELLEENGKIDLADLDWGNVEEFFLDKRPGKLTVQLYAGDISQFDCRLADADAVVAIELIEHLYPETLEKVPEVIFGKIRPFIAILTTPNVEFNVLFDMTDRKFRHDDHKFEWTRAEFQEWANSIVAKYPDYEVTFEGLGSPPEAEDEHLGHCSQMAVFRCKNKIKKCKDSTEAYEQVLDITYPNDPHHNRESRIRSDCYQICSDLYWDDQDNENFLKRDGGVGIPLEMIYERLDKSLLQYCKNKWVLGATLMQNGFKMRYRNEGFENGFATDLTGQEGYIMYITEPEPESESENSDEEQES